MSEPFQDVASRVLHHRTQEPRPDPNLETIRLFQLWIVNSTVEPTQLVDEPRGPRVACTVVVENNGDKLDASNVTISTSLQFGKPTDGP